MLLLIDVGNTNTVFALYREREPLGQWRLSTARERTAEEYAALLIQLMSDRRLSTTTMSARCSSRRSCPQTVFPLRKMSRNFFGREAFVCGEDIPIPIENKLLNPREAGADRLVNALAAVRRYTPPLIVVDFGTATTFDVVDEEGAFLGGIIAPGINLSIEALHLAAAQLPRIAVEPPPAVIGRSTVQAMQSGVFWGYVGLIEGLANRVQAEYGKSMTYHCDRWPRPAVRSSLQHRRACRPRSDDDRPGRDLPPKSRFHSLRQESTTVTAPLRFVALGGIGEIGMNLYLYELDGQWLMVDCGITFADDRHPGADIIMPDIAFIEERKDKLKGIVITHAHEDHIGAVPYLWERLGCPLYCTAFPAAVLRRKLAEHDTKAPTAIRQVESGTPFTVGPFACRLVHMTHSIPEANALAIETPYGIVMHTGD